MHDHVTSSLQLKMANNGKQSKIKHNCHNILQDQVFRELQLNTIQSKHLQIAILLHQILRKIAVILPKSHGNAASDCTHAANHQFAFESCPLIQKRTMTPPTFNSQQFGQLAEKSLHFLHFPQEVSTLSSISHTAKSLPFPWTRPLLCGSPTSAAPLRHVSVNGCLKGMLEIRWSRGSGGGRGGDDGGMRGAVWRGQTRHTLPRPAPPLFPQGQVE